MKNRNGEAKNVFHPTRVGGRGGVQQRLLESARGSKIYKKRLKRFALCKQGAADLKATPHAADPLNEMKKKKCLAEREGFRYQNSTKNVSKTSGTKREAKTRQGTFKDTLAEQGRKKYAPPNSTKRLLWILPPPTCQNATSNKDKTYSFLKSNRIIR